jgi:hypothetical protein
MSFSFQPAVCGFPRYLLRKAGMLCFMLFWFLSAGCAGLSLATPRDARILPKGTHEVHGASSIILSGSSGTDYEPPSAGETMLGGAHLDVLVRGGLGDDSEHAYRFGVWPLGAYGGYERAYRLFQSASLGGVWFGGAIGGLALGEESAALPFVQPYLGTVIGINKGPVRPEVAIRVTGQGGIASHDGERNVYYGYLMGLASAEPRIRIKDDALSLYFGIVIGTGYGRCQECFQVTSATAFFAGGPVAGVSLEL